MELWLAMQHPNVVLLIGAVLAVLVIGIGFIISRLVAYWVHARGQRAREDAFLAAAIAVGIAAGSAELPVVTDDDMALFLLDAEERDRADDEFWDQELYSYGT